MHIAQFNLARLRHGPDDPKLTSFGIGANMIQRAAAATPGHVWSQQDVIADNIFATRSVWSSIDALREFVYTGIHRRYLDRSSTWFLPGDGANMVLWRIEPGVEPSLETAQSKLDTLRRDGPGPEAFDFASAPEDS